MVSAVSLFGKSLWLELVTLPEATAPFQDSRRPLLQPFIPLPSRPQSPTKSTEVFVETSLLPISPSSRSYFLFFLPIGVLPKHPRGTPRRLVSQGRSPHLGGEPLFPSSNPTF